MSLKQEISLNQPQLNPTYPFQRIDVLSNLWEDFKQLKQIKDDIQNKRRVLTPELKYIVYVLQVRSQIGKCILFGLRDNELDEMMREIGKIKQALGT